MIRSSPLFIETGDAFERASQLCHADEVDAMAGFNQREKNLDTINGYIKCSPKPYIMVLFLLVLEVLRGWRLLRIKNLQPATIIGRFLETA